MVNRILCILFLSILRLRQVKWFVPSQTADGIQTWGWFRGHPSGRTTHMATVLSIPTPLCRWAPTEEKQDEGYEQVRKGQRECTKVTRRPNGGEWVTSSLFPLLTYCSFKRNYLIKEVAELSCSESRLWPDTGSLTSQLCLLWITSTRLRERAHVNQLAQNMGTSLVVLLSYF